MAWEFIADRPIYAQIVERIQLRILSGQYPPGSWLPSVRDLAAEAAVNPNTMQKAFAELERNGLIVTLRTSGRMVTEDATLLQEIKAGLAREKMDIFFTGMKELGYTERQAVDLLGDRLRGEEIHE